MADLLISVVTWNSGTVIGDCLRSILALTFSDFDLVIVDNNSQDNTRDVVRSCSDPRLRLLCMDQNLGFAGGHNVSIRNSTNPYVLLVNPDVRLRPDYVDNALRVMQADERCGTVCGLLVRADPSSPDTDVDASGLIVRRDRRFMDRMEGWKLAEAKLERTEVFGADGALPLYRRKMIDDLMIGGQFFDERFFVHKEDWDVAWRSQLLGWRTIFEPSCVAVHPRTFRAGNLAVRKAMSREVRVHAVKNQLYLILKNEDLANFIRDCFPLVLRQLLVFFYCLLFERYSLRAYREIWRNRQAIRDLRKEIHRRRKIDPGEIRRRFKLGLVQADPKSNRDLAR